MLHFVLIFEITLIYLLIVLKVDGNFRREKSQLKTIERDFLFYFLPKNEQFFFIKDVSEFSTVGGRDIV